MDYDLPTGALADRWEDVQADLDARAATLEAAGWDVVALHTGDCTTLSGEGERGIDVLVPDDEFEALEAALDGGATFTETSVYRQAAGGVAFFVGEFRDPDREVAAVLAAFYPQRGRDATRLAEQARDAGAVDLLVRPLGRDRIATLAIEDPALVFPEDWS